MKKTKLLALVIALILVSTVVLAACQQELTISIKDVVTEEVVAEITVKVGDTWTPIDGYLLDGNVLYYSKADYEAATDSDKENDPEASFDTVEGKFEQGHTELWGAFISTGVATGSGYTYTTATSEFPATWNPFVYETNTESTLMGYLVDDLYVFDFNATKDGYEIVPSMAVGEPVDVSSTYADSLDEAVLLAAAEEIFADTKAQVVELGLGWSDEQIMAYCVEALLEEGVGITPAGWEIDPDAEHRAYRITLRSDLKWQDGTAITARDYINSLKYLLNPAAQNSRADDYTYSGSLVIHNAKQYLLQGQVGYFPASTAYTTYEESLDSKLVFTLGNSAEVKALLGSEQVVYMRSAMGFPESYNAARCAAYLQNSYISDLDLEIVKSMEGKTLEEIKADAAMKEQWELIIGWWQTDPNEELHFFMSEYTWPEMEFDQVGIKYIDDTHFDVILDEELKGFYLKYALGFYLVHPATYEANESVRDGIYINRYGTSVETTMSYGPYKLTYFQKDKSYKLEKNANWWGHAANPTQYQATTVNVIKVANAATRLQMFLSGQLDVYGLTSNDMETYQMSDHTYFQKDASTFFVALNPDLEAYQTWESNNPGKNRSILTIKEFRQALSFALDRSAFALATAPTNGPAFAAYSDLIISNPEEGIAYRTTELAKDAVLAFWGLADQVGPDKQYKTKDEAIESITGYDPAGAKRLFDAAYDKAIAAGLMKETDVIEIAIGTPNLTSSFYNGGYEFLVNCYTEAVKGTKLEGKLTFTRDGTLGDAFGDAIRSNQVNLLFGVGFSGSALNAFGLQSVYTDDDENLRYDPATHYKNIYLTIHFDNLQFVNSNVVLNGDYTASIDTWTSILDNKAEKVQIGSSEETMTFKTTSDDYNIKTLILASLEKAMLENYNMIPLIDDSSAQLKGMKVKYYVEDYVFGVGRGGVKYMTFNYTDDEWAAFVRQNGGELNYK